MLLCLTCPVATKKKGNKKKKSTKKLNGDAPRSLENDKDLLDDNEEDGETEEVEQSVAVRSTLIHLSKRQIREAALIRSQTPAKDLQSNKAQTNGHNYEIKTNGYAEQVSALQSPSKRETDEEAVNTSDTSARFEAMSQEREALRAEVEQLRKSLEDIQDKHAEEVNSIKGRYGEDLSSIQTKHTEEVSRIKNDHVEEVSAIEAKHIDVVSKLKEEHTEELSTIRTELEETEAAKDQAETQYQALLGRINTIKSSLGERLKADKQELAESKEQIEDLEAQNDELQQRVNRLEAELKELEVGSKESSKELSTLRNRHNLSQQNWVSEREELIQETKHLREEADAAKEAMGDWEVLAMEERSNRENLTLRLQDLEEQYSSQKEAYETTVMERDDQSQAVAGLQRALQEVQDARKRELREMVESYEAQVQSLKQLVQQSDARSTEAEAAKDSLQAELERLMPFEKEVKEKNLLIGKLRHEAIVLNDHLTKALRFLKKAKPEDNIDRYAPQFFCFESPY